MDITKTSIILGQFFKDQFDSRFQQYRDDIHALIEAQQNHVRRIVHTAILDQCSEVRWLLTETLSYKY